MTHTAPRPRLRAALSTLLTALLVAAGVSISAAPAQAAVGDVAGATLDWGIKSSFTNYIQGPIAHGGWTVEGDVSQAAPFHWGSGAGAASQADSTGSVGYGSSIHFTGHAGVLDVTFSDFRVELASATSASIVLDAVYGSMTEPGVFTTVDDITFATLDLAAATIASTGDTVAYTGAPATLTEAGAAAFAGFYGAGTALDVVSFSWPVEQAPPPPVPTISVSKTTDLHPGGETITITGTGFAPQPPATTATRPPLAGKFGGAYVVFGKFPETWKPSAGVPSSQRKVGAQAWVMNPEDAAAIGSGAVPINADGSFSVTLFVERGYTGEPAAGNYGIYTYGGSGASYAPFETYTPVSFSTSPMVAVSQASDLDPLGDTVTVQGWNFGPNAPATNGKRPPLAGKFGGAYVVFGSFPSAWQPSAGIPGAARNVLEQLWVVNPEDVAALGAGAVPINPDGSFEVSLEVARDLEAEALGGTYGIYTYGGSGSNYAAFETATPIAFTAAAPTSLALTASPNTGLVVGGTTTLRAQVTPAVAGAVTFRNGSSVLGTVEVDAAGIASLQLTNLAEGTMTIIAEFAPADVLLYAPTSATLALAVGKPAVAAGSLTWGIKESFRNYVIGPIAHGSITVSGVGTSGGAFVFGQGTGGSFDPATNVGSSNYTGSVRFTGHNGLLDVTFANPVVRVDSQTSGALLVTVNGSQVAIATLDLAAGSRSTPGGAVAYSGVPATLTGAGAGVFAYNGSAFYPAGTALDPVSFTIGSPSSAGGGTTTIASFAGDREPAPTAPSTTGITVVTKGKLVAGEVIEVTADGFEAGEQGILVVIYSDPVVLARDATADANGVVTWSGRLPAGLAGKHTLTFQGSVDRGVVLDIQPKMQTAAEGCPVDDAILTWGFKESFRSYISGSIANGEWIVADGATYAVPNFAWSGGTGAYDAETAEGLIAFAGSIQFTGHGGVLNTTVSNPQLQFLDESTAVLLLDVAGTTQDGTPVTATAVEFAELDLSGSVVDLADGVVTITGAPAVLAAEGAAAFGTYEAGEELDPISAEFTLDAACAEPIVADEPTATPVDTTSSTGDLGWIPWAIGGLALLALVVVLIVAALRRRSADAG